MLEWILLNGEIGTGGIEPPHMVPETTALSTELYFTVGPLLSFKASASRRKTSLFGPDTGQQDKQ